MGHGIGGHSAPTLSAAPTRCLSGSPGVTTGVFYYSVKWGVKECHGCSHFKRTGWVTAGWEDKRTNPPLACFRPSPLWKRPHALVPPFRPNLSRNMLTSRRIITCVPHTIQTDGGLRRQLEKVCLRDLRHWHPKPADRLSSSITFLFCSPTASIAIHKARCANGGDLQPQGDPLILTVRPQMSQAGIASI